jgi:hypothetical protein
VHVAARQATFERSALKAHYAMETYIREREVYHRLQAASVKQIQSLNVPQLPNSDDDLFVIEMSIVTKPFLLDFASNAGSSD